MDYQAYLMANHAEFLLPSDTVTPTDLWLEHILSQHQQPQEESLNTNPPPTLFSPSSPYASSSLASHRSSLISPTFSPHLTAATSPSHHQLMMDEPFHIPQTWLVCGSDSPFADLLIQTILACGDRVVATAPDVNAISHLVAIGATPLELDITECPTELDRKIRQIGLAFGQIDVVVMNAGLGPLGALEELSPQALGDQFNTCLFGVANLARAVFHNIRGQESGHVALISSASSWISAPGMGSYQSSKASVDGLIRAMAADLQPSGIETMILQVNSTSELQAYNVPPQQGSSSGLLYPQQYDASSRRSSSRRSLSHQSPMMDYSQQPEEAQRLVNILVNVVKSKASQIPPPASSSASFTYPHTTSAATMQQDLLQMPFDYGVNPDGHAQWH